MDQNVDATHPAELTLLEAAELLRSRELKAVELLDATLGRIEERNGGAPSFDGGKSAVNAWARIYPERAREQAQRADEQLDREGAEAPLLCGIPMGLKDLYSVEGLPLTASSQVLENHVAETTAPVAAQLESEGAVVLGHTHTHEFAAGGSTDQVGNPWNLERSAGGSSGGSAAALAAGMAQAALGTDTAGSVRIPASLCGVSGIKPTFNRVPIAGIVPLSPTLDHSGPLARTVADCAAVLMSMARAEHPAAPWKPVHNPALRLPLQAAEGGKPLEGLRIAVTGRNMTSIVEDDVVDGLQKAREACQELGATVVELPAPADLDKSDYDTILLAEARSYHRRYAHLEDKYRGSTRDFLAFGAEQIPVGTYLAAQERRQQVTALWADWFSSHGIDAVLEPTQAITAPTRGHGYDPDQSVGGEDPMTLFTALWNYTGFPAVTLPTHIGRQSGLPVSVSLISALGQEAVATSIGLALQRYALPPLGIAPVPADTGSWA